MADVVVVGAKLVLERDKDGKLKRECGILINEPGHLHGVDFHLSQRPIVGVNGTPEFDEDLVLYAEIDPGKPVRRRHFLVLELMEGRAMPDDVERTFIGKATSSSGRIMFVWELIKREPKSKIVRASC